MLPGMNAVKYFRSWLGLAVVLTLAGGCASTDSNVVKTRGVYTTVAVDGRFLDLPYSQYASCQAFGPGQTPAAVVAGYGDWEGGLNRPQLFTLQLFETGSGTLLFSKDGNAYYGKVATIPLPIRKSGDYQLKLLINNTEYDTWKFTVRREAGAVESSAAPAAYAKGRFGASLEPETYVDAFNAYDDALLEKLLNAVQKESATTDRSIFAQVQPGRVVIEFTLDENGRIESPAVTGNTLNEDLGRFFLRALTNGAPYPAWPAAARQALGRDAFKLKATFNYD
jgi:hypothetical protein